MALKMLAKVAPVVQTAAAVTEVEVPQHKVLVEPPQAVTEIEALTQEYIVLYRQFVQLDVKNLLSRMDTIKKALHVVANETMEAKQPAIFKCADGEVEFSERSKDTSVPKPDELIAHLTKKFNESVAMSVVDIRITPLRQILAEKELEPFLKVDDGSRSLRAVRPAASSAAA